MKYPSLKTTTLILVAALIVGVAFFLAEYRNAHTQNSLYTAPVLSTTASTTITLDEQDQDWKSVLLSAEPAIAQNASGTAATSIISNAPLTPTDKLARDFFGQYMLLHQQGLDTDPDSQQQLVEQVLANGMVVDTPKNYTAANLNVGTDSGTAATKQYGNSIAVIFQAFGIQSRNEAVIAQDSADKQDPTILKEIDPIVTSYKNIISGLLKVQVPPTVETLHLNLINSINEALFVAQLLRKSDTDTLAGLEGVSKYQDTVQDLSSALLALQNYFIAAGIQYSPTEPGHIFTKTQ